ncbi:hypothetical protein D5086_025249 [Populus alba]|uniref:Uncharacterized protein n=1 Tax=Populus alba TaxID=43335 RepID=A0ACC4AYL3_POPAL
MANSHLGLALFSLVLFFSLTKPTLSQDPSPTVFEILPKFGLPSGLLPKTVKSYSLADDGSFTVYLEKECYVEFDYLVYYEKKITGKLSYGSISNLKGIQVQRFFLWLGVDNIRVDLPPSDSIYFQVGWINKKLDVDQFKTVHSCRAGVSSGSCGGLWKQFLEYGLPRGLLPDNVESYTLSPSDGTFEVKLKNSCYAHFDEIVYYVSKVDSGMIKLFVGSISEELPAKQFEVVPACKRKVGGIRAELESMWKSNEHLQMCLAIMPSNSQEPSVRLKGNLWNDKSLLFFSSGRKRHSIFVSLLGSDKMSKDGRLIVINVICFEANFIERNVTSTLWKQTKSSHVLPAYFEVLEHNL